MANSNYYYDEYKQNKNNARKYEDSLKKLNNIYADLIYNMGDEISSINGKLEDLKSDLFKSIRHNGYFEVRTDAITYEQERSVTSDSYLNIAIRCLEDELRKIGNKKNQSEQNRDYYYGQYREQKDQERREFFNNIFNQ